MSDRVRLRSGPVEGLTRRGVRVFRGIPFARVPAGSGRFRAPEPVTPWSSTRDCRRPAAAAPQLTRRPAWLRRWSAVPPAGHAEDCLHLNVFAPAPGGRVGVRRPVMVFLHGGGFSHGSGSWYVYCGRRLARRGDVVVVTLNYRLGALGALDLRAFSSGAQGHAGTDGAHTNVTLRDQLAALEWVRDNVEAFGGDPEQVTLFGQSAGAMSIGALLAVPAARGLFQRAVLQSGAARNVLAPEQAAGVTRALLETLAIDPEGGGVVQALRARDVQEILAAQAEVAARHRLPLGMLAWQPVVDGDLLPVHPDSAALADVPLLLGTNRDEWKMFTATDARRRRLDRATLRAYLERTLARDRAHGLEHGGDEAGDAPSPGGVGVDELLERYGSCPETGARRSPAEIWVAFQTDRVFRRPAVELAERRASSGGACWMYRFDRAPWIARERVGACHAMELPFVFGTLREPMLRPLIAPTASALALAHAMQDAWIAFARQGDPRHDGVREWPAYRCGDGEARVFGGRSRRLAAMEPETRALWRVLSPPRDPGARAARA